MSQEDLITLDCPGRITVPASTGLLAFDQQLDCHLTIAAADLTVSCPSPGPVIRLAWRDIAALERDDYSIRLKKFDGSKLIVSHLGYRFEDALRQMRRFRNLQLAQDLLYKEEILQIYRQFNIVPPTVAGACPGPCDLHITRTGLVFLPDDGDPWRLAAADLTDWSQAEYSLRLGLEDGGQLTLNRLGNQLDPLLRDIGLMIGRLQDQTRQWLISLWPNAPEDELLRAVFLLLDGRAAACPQLVQAAPSLWPRLEDRLQHSPLAGEYRFLIAHSGLQHLSIGLKQGLWGQEHSQYLFLILRFPHNRRLVFEACLIDGESDQDSDEPGKASYFFAGDTLEPTAFARALRAVNFRREPIYLSDSQLQTDRYRPYLHAIAKIPALRELRRNFIARVTHRSPEQWQRDCLQHIQTPSRPNGEQNSHG